MNMFHRIFLMLFTIYRFQVLIETTKKFCESKTIIVTNGLVHNISIEYYNRVTFHPHPALMFNASDHFVIKLKKFIDYSTCRFHIKRIPDIIIQNTVIFLYRMKYLLGKGVNERIVNCDESFRRTNEFKLNT